MRTKILSNNTTVEYPDEISFCFNPVVINIKGGSWNSILVKITDLVSGKANSETREFFSGACYFDVSPYAQGAFDLINFNKVDYSVNGSTDANVGRNFSIEVDLYSGGSIGDSIQFNTFIIWGAMKVGERYNGDNVLTWFKNYPFSVGMYSAIGSVVIVSADGTKIKDVSVTGQQVNNIMLKGLDAVREIKFFLPGSSTAASVFDKTFDFTFRGLTNQSTTIICKVDESDCGVYMRWLDRHGFYRYWLFKRGDESRQVSNDGEFIRNNMADYSFVNGYHGGTGRKQRKAEETTLPICAPLVDTDTYDILYQMSLSPVVDMYAGKDVDGNPRWITVNVSVANYIKTRKYLQDFTATIILPETPIQSL